jgi:hypothetical protein
LEERVGCSGLDRGGRPEVMGFEGVGLDLGLTLGLDLAMLIGWSFCVRFCSFTCEYRCTFCLHQLGCSFYLASG